MRVRSLDWSARIALGVFFAGGTPIGAANTGVDVFSNFYLPQNVTILVGDTVTWARQSGTHNVLANDASFRCAAGCDQTGGDGDPSSVWTTASFQFNSPGFDPYHCEFHGVGMNGSVRTLRAIFADGFEGGAGDDQWAAIALAGDYCATAIDVPANVGGLPSSLAGVRNDSDLTFDASCLGTAAHGRDRVFKFTVASGVQVTATATPVGSSLDLAIYLIPAAQCDLVAPPVCLQAADNAVAGDPETVTHTNDSGGTQEVFLFVDSLSAASAGGAFTLTVEYNAF